MTDVIVSGRRPAALASKDVSRAIACTFRTTRTAERGSVGVAFVSNTAIRTLNRRWRKLDRSTDVLSFAPPQLPATSKAPKQWGDIFVSPAYVRTEARRRSIAFREELLRVVIHGMLHLFGYDHATDAEETEMFSLQERCLARTLRDV